MPYNFVGDSTVFAQRNLVADFPQVKCNFRRNAAIMRFAVPLGGVVGLTYDVRFRLIGKRVVDFILGEPFSTFIIFSFIVLYFTVLLLLLINQFLFCSVLF